MKKRGKEENILMLHTITSKIEIILSKLGGVLRINAYRTFFSDSNKVCGQLL